jgi:hypothetical protein
MTANDTSLPIHPFTRARGKWINGSDASSRVMRHQPKSALEARRPVLELANQAVRGD